ncbi:hypothetical protein HYH03_007016 [Edaphochlamys debaryana]|uniref:Guanylate cyclase domain-containing protein n=1 Tax=Edaphochlamys debaryana TaxID=47281 RepID=A0A836C0B6_9CHLO|nr:hypothetical protein HYH03_007016 [Edaphochlamys debaryana]|eukprot:KAG2494772.1 hypothetical protein HYH03_007016 [Edaphochlamys debaryana]
MWRCAWLVFVTALAIVRVASADTGLCESGIVDKLQAQCGAEQPEWGALLEAYTACASRPLRVLAPTSSSSWITRQANQFQALTGRSVNVTLAEYYSVPSLISQQAASYALQDVWIVDGASLPYLAWTNTLLPLESLISADPGIDWRDVEPQWAALANADGHTWGVPLDSDSLLMFYRRDAFAANNLTVPASWDELADLASSWNASRAVSPPVTSTASPSAPLPRYGLCLNDAPVCMAAVYLSAILASYTQLQGPTSGWAVDPVNADPLEGMQLVNGSAMSDALTMYGRLLSLSPRGLFCQQITAMFAAGQCLVTIAWSGRQFKTLQAASVPVRGLVGMAMLPGSTRVLNRGTGQLESVAGPGSCREAVPTGAGGWACRAPFLAYGGTFGVVPLRTDSTYQKLGYSFLSFLSSAVAQWDGILDPLGPVEPTRTSMLESEGMLVGGGPLVNGTRWDPADAREYLAALRATFRSPNAAPELGAPASFTLRLHMENAAEAYLQGTPAAAAADAMLQNWLSEWRQRGLTLSQVQAILRESLSDPNAPPPSPPDSTTPVAAPAPASSSDEGLPGWAIAVIVVGSVAVLLVFAGAARWVRLRSRRKAYLRRIVPPLTGPETSLVVTDIQDSTKMWELLSSDVMDSAIYQHHNLARRLILKFGGYESATEGDSFIIAFHAAHDGVCFCASFQQELLLLPWPAELLLLEGCQSLWMCKSEPEAPTRRQRSGANMQLEVARSPAPLSRFTGTLGSGLGAHLAHSGVGLQSGIGVSGHLHSGVGASNSRAGSPLRGNTPKCSEPGINNNNNVMLNTAGSPWGTAAATAGPLAALQAASGGAAASVHSSGGGSGMGSGQTAALVTNILFAPGASAPSHPLPAGPDSPPVAGSLPPAAPGHRYGRGHSTGSPLGLPPTAGGSLGNLGALGASPRQLSFLGRSASRLRMSTAATGGGGSATADGPLKVFPRGLSLTTGTLHLSAAALRMPVAFGGSEAAGGGGGGGNDGGAAGGSGGVAAAARASLAQGGVMSFRDSFRQAAPAHGAGTGPGPASAHSSPEHGTGAEAASDGEADADAPAQMHVPAVQATEEDQEVTAGLQRRTISGAPVSAEQEPQPTLTGFPPSALYVRGSVNASDGRLSPAGSGVLSADPLGGGAGGGGLGSVIIPHSASVEPSQSSQVHSSVAADAVGPMPPSHHHLLAIQHRLGSSSGQPSGGRPATASGSGMAPTALRWHPSDPRSAHDSALSESTDMRSVSEFGAAHEGSGQLFDRSSEVDRPGSDSLHAPSLLRGSTPAAAAAARAVGHGVPPPPLQPAGDIDSDGDLTEAAAATAAARRRSSVAADGGDPFGRGLTGSGPLGEGVGQGPSPLGSGSHVAPYSPRAAANAVAGRRGAGGSVTFDVGPTSAGSAADGPGPLSVGGNGGSNRYRFSSGNGKRSSGGAGNGSSDEQLGPAGGRLYNPSRSRSHSNSGPHSPGQSGSGVLPAPLTILAPVSSPPASQRSSLHRRSNLSPCTSPRDSRSGAAGGPAQLASLPAALALQYGSGGGSAAGDSRFGGFTPSSAARLRTEMRFSASGGSPGGGSPVAGSTATDAPSPGSAYGAPAATSFAAASLEGAPRPSPLGRGVSHNATSAAAAAAAAAATAAVPAAAAAANPVGLSSAFGSAVGAVVGRTSRSSANRHRRSSAGSDDGTGGRSSNNRASVEGPEAAEGLTDMAQRGLSSPLPRVSFKAPFPQPAPDAPPAVGAQAGGASGAAAAADGAVSHAGAFGHAVAGGGGGGGTANSSSSPLLTAGALAAACSSVQGPSGGSPGPMGSFGIGRHGSLVFNVKRSLTQGPPGHGHGNAPGLHSSSATATPTAALRASQAAGFGGRGLFGLVGLPSPRPGGAGGGLLSLGLGGSSHATPLLVDSRQGSMASMMRLASQHNLLTVGESLCTRWRVVDEGEPGAQLVFRGLRVRMGVHSGLEAEQNAVTLNRTLNRMQYSGLGLQMAKAVCDAAHGGQVLMSEAAFTQLAVEGLKERVMVLHMGEHRIKDELPPTSIYCGCPRSLQGRLPSLRTVRSSAQHSLGVLDAPAGSVVVVFMHVVGAMGLLDWRPDLAATALAMFRDHVTLELIKFQGYLVEAVDGLVLASFSAPAAGLRWAAKCQHDMTMLPWPQELLTHEACEELCTQRPNPVTGVSEDVVLFRGLRLKAGIDVGRLRGEINCITGRMSYRGRAMNRAARIVAAAGSGQILATSEVWLSTSSQAAARMCGLSGTSLGQFNLKGVSEAIEVYQIKTSADLPTSNRAKAILASGESPLELDELPIADPATALQHHTSISNHPSNSAVAAAAAAAVATASSGSGAGAAAEAPPARPPLAAIRSKSGITVGGSRGTADGSAAALVAAGAGGGGSFAHVPARMALERVHSMGGGLTAALRRDESMGRSRAPLSRQLSRQMSLRGVSRRSSRRSSVNSQYSVLAASAMVAAARGSFDGRTNDLDRLSNPASPTASGAAAAVAAVAGPGVAATAALLVSGGTGSGGGGSGGGTGSGSGGGGSGSVAAAATSGMQASVLSPVASVQMPPPAYTYTTVSVGSHVHAGGSRTGSRAGTGGHSHSRHEAGAPASAGAGGMAPANPAALLPNLGSVGSGTRTSRGSYNPPGGDLTGTTIGVGDTIDGARSSAARSSAASHRSAPPPATMLSSTNSQALLSAAPSQDTGAGGASQYGNQAATTYGTGAAQAGSHPHGQGSGHGQGHRQQHVASQSQPHSPQGTARMGPGSSHSRQSHHHHCAPPPLLVHTGSIANHTAHAAGPGSPVGAHGLPTVTPTLRTPMPRQGLVRHLSTLIRTASIALYGASTAAVAGRDAPGSPPPLHSVGSVGAVGVSLANPNQDSVYEHLGSIRRTGGHRTSDSRAAREALATTTGFVGGSSGGVGVERGNAGGPAGATASGYLQHAAAGGAAGGHGGAGAVLRELLPPRLRAAGSLFRVGSFSGQVRRRGEVEPRPSDVGEPSPLLRRARSPAARRVATTASGLAYVAGPGVLPAAAVSPVVSGGRFASTRGRRRSGGESAAAWASPTAADRLSHMGLVGALTGRRGQQHTHGRMSLAGPNERAAFGGADDSFVIVVGEDGESDGEMPDVGRRDRDDNHDGGGGGLGGGSGGEVYDGDAAEGLGVSYHSAHPALMSAPVIVPPAGEAADESPPRPPLLTLPARLTGPGSAIGSAAATPRPGSVADVGGGGTGPSSAPSPAFGAATAASAAAFLTPSSPGRSN